MNIPEESLATQPLGWATKEDWTKHQNLLLELYKQHSLKEVKEIMKGDHGFRATDNMYKKHFRQWNARRYNAANEMRAIVRINAHRTGLGKASAFTIRGKAVDFKEVIRYWERRGLPIDDVTKLREMPRTPEAVQCFSPLQSPLKTPEILAAPEYILVKLQDYIEGSFDAGVWKNFGEENKCESMKSHGDGSGDLSVFYNQCHFAYYLFGKNRFQEAREVLDGWCADLKRILLEEDPFIFRKLFALVLDIASLDKHEITRAILRYISTMGATLYGCNHPFKLITMEISSLRPADQEEILLRGLRKICDCFEHALGPMHVTTLNCRVALIGSITDMQDPEEAERPLCELLRHCESSLRENDPRVLSVYMAVGFYHFIQRNFIQAKEIAQRILALLKHMGHQVDCLTVRRDSLRCLALSHYELGEVQVATTMMREAIDLYLYRDSPEMSLACRLMLELEDWLAELGDFGSAAEVEERRLGIQESLKANDV